MKNGGDTGMVSEIGGILEKEGGIVQGVFLHIFFCCLLSKSPRTD